MAETELAAVPGWTAQQVARLAEVWITSAEQVLAISVTSGGIRSLAAQLQLPDAEAQRLVHLARAALGPKARAAMSQRADVQARGMGALRPDKEGEDDQEGSDSVP